MTRGASVSVIVPVRDGELFVAQALHSVLEQTEPPDEIVVVDDGSTDGTRRILDGFGSEIVIVPQPPSGFAAAVNRGVAASSGSLLAFLDADDVWARDKLARQRRVLVEQPELDAVFGHATQFVDRERVAPDREFRIDPRPQPSQLLSAMLVRRVAYDRVGPLDGGYPSMANVDWFARALDLGLRFETLPDVVMHRRIHGENLSLRAEHAKKEDAARLLRAHLARRRRGS